MAENERYEFVMQMLLECNDEDIALLLNLCSRSLCCIKKVPNQGTLFDLLKDTLGSSIPTLYQYMHMMNVCNEMVDMTIKD